MAQGKQNGVHFTGPVRTKAMRSGSSGVYGRQASITIAALAAGATGTYTFTDEDAELGDVVCCSPASAPEAGVIIASARVSAAGTISVRIVNGSGDALTGGAQVLYYWICK